MRFDRSRSQAGGIQPLHHECNASPDNSERNVDAILQSSPLSMGLVRSVRDMDNKFIPGKTSYERELRSHVEALENILWRSIFRRFGDGQLQCARLVFIPCQEVFKGIHRRNNLAISLTAFIHRVNREINLETFTALVRSQANLTTLQVQGITPPDSKIKDIKIKQDTCLRVISCEYCHPVALPFFFQCLYMSARSLTHLKLGLPSRFTHGKNYSNEVLEWIKVFGEKAPSANRPGLLEEFEAEVRNNLRDPIIELPFLKNLQILRIPDIARLFDKSPRIDFKCPNLQQLRLDNCDHPEEFLESLLVPITPDIGLDLQSLQLYDCYCDWDSLGRVLRKLKPLRVLQLAVNSSGEHTYEAVNNHCRSLKKLWLECKNTTFPCTAASRFLDPGLNPLTFNSENWPNLEELAVEVPGRLGWANLNVCP